MSKRMLLELVEGGHVAGWDDPRMPTLAGLRRRGYTPESIRNFCERIGVAKRNNVVDIANLEHAIREDLNVRAPRVMAVLNPLKVVIENYPEGSDRRGRRHQQPGGFVSRNAQGPVRPRALHRARRLHGGPAEEVLPAVARQRSPAALRLLHQVHRRREGSRHRRDYRAARTYDPATRGGDSPDGRKVKATLHWVSAAHALDAEVRLYDRLFTVEDPAGTENFLEHLNPNVARSVSAARRSSRAWPTRPPGSRYQFERLGYFCVDPDSTPGGLVFNRTVSLRDTWARIAQKGST